MYVLRDYQEQAVQATLRHFRKSRDPALIVLPTGAGKSLVIAELARIAKGRVLVLAHVKELVEQNYSKFCGYGLDAGIYSAGLQRKDFDYKVIFGSIQSIARAPKSFFDDFSLLIIDECHRVNMEDGTQYREVMERLHQENPKLCILGLTATPYRLDGGWIYEYHEQGFLRTQEKRIFRKCLFELSLRDMLERGYLTPPVQIDAPVASYDFSSLQIQAPHGSYSLEEIEEVLKSQNRITPGIVHNILEMSARRRGVIIFTASVRHAKEILQFLPAQESAMVIADTPGGDRDNILERFKSQKLKYLVNVSVLTTGFDAPHVDVIAILRPTESVTLYQQIVGRGLRLFEGKRDCLVLDYTGVPHDIFQPSIWERKPHENSMSVENSVPVRVSCPKCSHENTFWGLRDESGEVLEHYGESCSGAKEDAASGDIIPCGFRYRFQICQACGAENDRRAGVCSQCAQILESDDAKLQEAHQAKDAHVMRPDSMYLEKKSDAKGKERLEVRYYDHDGQFLSEIFFFDSLHDAKVFHYNFLRMHKRRPEEKLRIQNIDEALAAKDKFRCPLFVIARKQKHYWKIREKIFR